MKKEIAVLNSLRERVADAEAPDRQLFIDVWFACTGTQSPDTKVRFAVLLDALAWADAALLLATCALPGQRLELFWSAGGGRALSVVGASASEDGAAAAAYHSGRVGLAILAAVLDCLTER
ncbi:hypothetical protein [Methylobacterium durans]|uniref:Uncharacterized protein n=1 Tax=Methylobacterium durans TaxID=2202825 RepID=A0A2U8W0K0_9HYPH|nr:hypothetical protein [Methylobacterium durans]AWN39594.1 hypothetical protein DK389_02440 [Methylobacterium durans]